MSLPAELAADLEEIEADLGLTFTWPAGSTGTEYPCVTGSLTRGRHLVVFGFGPNADVVIIVRAEHFGTGDRPESKQKLTFNSRTYRIQDVILPAGEPFLKLICVDAAQAES